MGTNIGENIRKKLVKYSQNLLNQNEKSARDACKTSSKTAIQKTAETTDGLIQCKIAIKSSKSSE